MTKKIVVLLLTCILLVSTMVACNGNTDNGGNGGGTTTDTSGLPTILADLVDYGSAAKYYTVTAVSYTDSVREKAISDLTDKQKEQIAKFDPDEDGVFTWKDDTNTFTKIFCNADMTKLVDKFAAAALDQTKMVKLVAYICREEIDRADGEYGLKKGETSAIQDYEEIDELYDAYDEDDSDKNYDNLQLKKRKVMYELDQVFGDKADQCARVATEVIAYSQEVVQTEMMRDYTQVDNSISAFNDYCKEELYDYETLVYFLAFNETTGYKYTGDGYTIDNRKDITTLYGYYYQYERADYFVFPDEDLNETMYKEYLKLSHRDYFDTLSDAKKYNDYERMQYTGSYRYSDSFYNKYYIAHFNFQGLQEKYDRTVYTGGTNNTFSSGLGYASGTNTYSSEMLAGLNVGLKSTLKLSDADYVYSGVEANVTNMNTANTNWNKLSDEDQDKTVNKIYKVLFERQQLISQKFSMYYTCDSDSTRSVTSGDLTYALQYQIKSYSGDYIRNIQSYKKDDVILNKDLARLIAKGATATEIAEKEEEIGRNYAMLQNLITNYGGANIDEQMTTSNNAEWAKIKTNIEDTINPGAADGAEYYQTYHARHQKGNVVAVDQYFEDILIKKTYSCGGDAEKCNNDNSHANCTTEYDTDHALSHLIYNHENVFRYMYGQITVSYLEPNTNNGLSSYTISQTSAAFVAGTFYADNNEDGNLDGAAEYAGGSGIHSSLADTNNCTYNSKAIEEEDLATDEAPTLATINKSNKWAGIYLQGSTAIDGVYPFTVEKKDNNINYVYYFEFAGWYIDQDLKWPALKGETYDFDIALYPAFYITKVKK